MSQTTVSASVRQPIADCWNRIGVRGDSSCPELKKHVHCRNCPVYSAAAIDMLDRELPAATLARWTGHVAQEKWVEELDTHSVVVFRLGDEWLALPTASFKEVAGLRAIHTLPHLRNGVVLGMANIRGELLVCVSLQQVLGIEAAAPVHGEPQRALEQRLLVMQHQGLRLVGPVDEVYGIQRFHPRELKDVPATVAKAKSTYTRALLMWQGKSVGLLDEELLFYTLNRSLALATAI